MLSAKLIEAVLVEQDPEGLISLGAPGDEYESEAKEIYERLIRKQNIKHFLENAFDDRLMLYISTIAFVFNESFGSGTQYKGDDPPTFWFNEKYIPQRLEQIKIIAKLIIDLANKELT